jgi:hypothetical protein
VVLKPLQTYLLGHETSVAVPDEDDRSSVVLPIVNACQGYLRQTVLTCSLRQREISLSSALPVSCGVDGEA